MYKLTENIFQAGDHGSTFGGNLVVCDGAVKVLNQISNADFLADVNSQSDYIRKKLLSQDKLTE